MINYLVCLPTWLFNAFSLLPVFQATLTMDGNTLVHDQKGNKEKEEKDSVIRRTFDGDTMTLVGGWTTLEYPSS